MPDAFGERECETDGCSKRAVRVCQECRKLLCGAEQRQSYHFAYVDPGCWCKCENVHEPTAGEMMRKASLR